MIDVVIPVYNPDEKFFRLIHSFAKQNRKPEKIIVMMTVENDESNEWDALSEEIRRILDGDGATDLELEVHPVGKKDFYHGRTRNRGAAYGHNPYILFMTQDAVPTDNSLLEKLMEKLEMNSDVSQVYARQTTDEKAPDYIKYTQEFNYPLKSEYKNKDTYERLGIKNIFCSNVCCMYRRDIFDYLGGFEDKVIFNEDMLYARKAIDAGYIVVYNGDASVIHYHKYNLRQHFKRNFDMAVSQKMNQEAFKGLSSTSEGKRLVKRVIGVLWKNKKYGMTMYFILLSIIKYIGYLFGKNYNLLPYGLRLRFSSNPSFWSEG